MKINHIMNKAEEWGYKTVWLVSGKEGGKEGKGRGCGGGQVERKGKKEERKQPP